MITKNINYTIQNCDREPNDCDIDREERREERRDVLHPIYSTHNTQQSSIER
jgi:hypothetical protein